MRFSLTRAFRSIAKTLSLICRMASHRSHLPSASQTEAHSTIGCSYKRDKMCSILQINQMRGSELAIYVACRTPPWPA